MKTFATFAFTLALGMALAQGQTSKNWNGSAGDDWFNANNWTPAGVPAPGDTITVASGNPNLTAPVTVSGQFNWSGGTLNGNPLTIASGGVLNLVGSGSKFLQNILTNAGTVNWTDGTLYVVNNGSASYRGAIENRPGAVWDAQADKTLANYFGGTAAYFNNLGIVKKSAGSGTTHIGIVFNNAGSVAAQQGTLDFQNGGTIEGTFTADASTVVQFSGGAFSYSSVPVLTGPGAFQFTGGALTLIDNVIANLQLTGGTLTLGPGFQGGSITNLACGSTLNGNYTVSGILTLGGGVNGGLTLGSAAVLNWSGGTITGSLSLSSGSKVNWTDGTLSSGLQIVSAALVNWGGGTANGPVNVAAGGSLILGGSGSKFVFNVLTNAGTVTWTNGTVYVGNNGSATYAGAIENLGGGLFDVQCDKSLASYFGGTNAYFHNVGTLRKSAASATTSVSVPIYNSGTVIAEQGTLNFQNGGVIEGSFTAAAGAVINLSGGAFSYSVLPVVTGPGVIQFSGGTLTLLADVIPNLQLSGGTLTLGPAFQGGSITNLSFGGTLSGNYSVTGTLSLGGGVNGSLSIAGTGVVNWNGGDISGSLALVSGSVLNWSGGTLAGLLNIVPGASVNWSGGTASGPVNVASGASLVLGGSGSKFIFNELTNAGTVTWTNGTVYVGNNGSASYTGRIENLGGGLFDVQCDKSLANYFGGTNAYFHNVGMLQKSGLSGKTSVSIPIYNSGTVSAQQGTLDFQNGAVVEGNFVAATGAGINFSGGAFSYTEPPTLSGAGLFQFSGGTLTLLNDAIGSLQLTGGTLSLAPSFQGGTITNLVVPGSALAGDHTVSGTLYLGGGMNGSLTVLNGAFVSWSGGAISGDLLVNSGALLNWSGGTASGPVDIASGASVVLGGTGSKYIFNVLTNAGLVTWTNGTVYVGNNGSGSYTGAIENLGGGLFDVECDKSLANYFGGTNGYFHNLGTFTKNSGSGATSVSVPIYNAGTVSAQQGTFDFQSGALIEGNFTAAAGAGIKFSGGAFSYNTPPVLTGPGSFLFTGGTLTLLSDVIPNLQMTGGTLTLGPAFQGGSITNLVMTGSTVTGNHTVSGTLTWNAGDFNGAILVTTGALLNWNGGTANGPVTIASGATLVLGGSGSKYIFNVLTNAGTVTWTDGTVYVGNNGSASYPGAIENLGGGLFDVQCDKSLANYFGGTNAYFHNVGTLRKSATSGTTSVSVSLYNAGIISAQQGTLDFQSGALIEGSFAAAAGAGIKFSGGAFSYNTPPTLTGPGSFLFTGGTLTLLSDVIPNLQLTGGTLTLGPGFQGGSITNLVMSGSTLAGNYTVSGTLNWNSGDFNGAIGVNAGGLLNWSAGTANGPINVANGGSLVLGGSASKYLFNVLTNAGTVTWTNATFYIGNNGSASYKGAIENLASGLFDIRCDQTLGSFFGGTSAYFRNLGTLQKSAGTGTTYVGVRMLNAGNLSLLSGIINFNSPDLYSQTGATLGIGLYAAGQSAPLVVSGNLSLDGTLAPVLSGYTPKLGDSLPLITCGTRTNSFNLVDLPAAGNNLAWRVAYSATGVSLQVVTNGNPVAQILGTVTDNNSAPVANLTVFAFTTNANNSVFLSTTTSGSGNYVLNVTNGVWRVGVQGLVARGYNDVPTQDVIVDNGNQTVNFAVQPYSGPSYTISVTASPAAGGSVSGGGVFLPGSPVTLTATPNTSTLPYYFAGWTENGLLQSGSSPYVFTAQRNRQIVGNFALPVFAITASNNPSGGGVISGAGSYIYGTTSVLTATPNFGYSFGSWTENGTVVGISPNLTTVVYTNHGFSANYLEANTNHLVLTATQPPGLATVTGAGSYTNGQLGTFSAPLQVVSGQTNYFFARFMLTNALVSTNSTFSKTFSTVDPTNLQYVAVYASLGAIPAVTNVIVNQANPVPATTNFQIAFQFDRTMDTNYMPQTTFTNSAPLATQPVVPPGGRWATRALSNDTFYVPAVTLGTGMDGTINVQLAGARDPIGATLPLTNLYVVQLDAIPPAVSGITATPAVLSSFISWNTDEPSSSEVDYGTTAAYGLNSGLYGQLITAHGLTLYNLSPLTTYHYRVRSRDRAGNETISGDNTFTTFAAPDLQVTGLGVTGSLISGGNLVIAWTDTNSGSGATFSSWYDQLIVTNATTGQTLLNSSAFYDSGANGNLAPAGGRSRQTTFQLPNGPAGVGSLQVIVSVNAYGNQYETSGANNTQSLAVNSTLATYPDLQVTSLVVTNAQLQSGNTVGIRWNDANTGNASAGKSYSDKVVVVNQTTAQTLIDKVIQLDAATTPIPAGQSAPRQYSFVLPDGQAGAGTLQIRVVADTANEIFEYNAGGTAELNNSNSIAAVSVVAPYPDLIATNVVVPVTANAGQSVAVSWTDMNQGSSPATNGWYDQVFLTDSNGIGGGQLLASFAFTNGLAAGQSTSITQAVTLPQFVQGNRWIVVKANASASFFELNTTNNSGISTQAVAVSPTLLLSLSGASVSESAPANSMQGTLTRNGNLSAALPVLLSTVTHTNLALPTSVSIPAGQSAVTFSFGPVDNFVSGSPVFETITATASGFAPATAALTILQDDPTTLSLSLSTNRIPADAGTNAILGTVTRNANFGSALNVILVSDNTGNVLVPPSVTIPAGQRSATFGVTPVPVAGLTDTRRANILASAPGFSSVSTGIEVLNVNTIQLGLSLLAGTVNKGAGSSADVGTVSIPAAMTVPQNVLLTVQNCPIVSAPSQVTIPAGAKSVNFNIAVANDNLSTGPQTAVILAQPMTLGRTVVTNGQATATLQVLDVNGPKLSLSVANATISKGSNTLVTVTRNTNPTNAITVSLASSPASIVSLPATVNLPLNQASATFTVTGILDGRQTGPEAVTLTASAAGYNSGAAPLTVSDIYFPDLVPLSIAAPTNGLTSTQVTVSWVEANNGLADATNRPWRDYVYVATDNHGQNTYLAALVTNTSSLAIGSTYTNQATFYLSPAPGNYWIMVVADGANVITELNKQNNSLLSSHPIAVNPVYRAAVTNVTPAVAPAGTPIVLSGWTYDPVSNQPVAGKSATIRIGVNGTRRVFPVTSDQNGYFTYTFQPLASEGGDYTVGADYPYVLQDQVQETFVILGMQAQPAGLVLQLLPNVPLTGQLVLSNLSDHPLSGLSVTVPDLQGKLTAEFNFTNNTLPGGGSTWVSYTLQSPVTRNAQIRFGATATSAEGAQVNIPITANVVPLVPQLVANPGYLASGMLVGQQTVASFDILNNGGAESGDLAVVLPTNLTWLKLSSPNVIPSIPPGGKATVTLLLEPAADLPLTLYTGNLAAFNANAGVSVQFQFRAVSTATGDLRVKATDDYTYYVAGGPTVTNATIIVRDPFTTAVIAQTNTDASGFAYFAALPAGPYTVDATAPKHNQFRGSASVVPGTVTDLESFMPRQLVTYQWSVVPTEITDNYKVVLESVFETEVPVPNVVVEEPRVMLLVAPGVASQFTIKLSNHGLIAANGVNITVPNDPKYLVTPLVTNVGTIPAQSSVEVPVTVELRSAPGPYMAKRLGVSGAKGDGCSLSDLNACLPDIPLGVNYYYVCGPNNVLQQRSVDLSVVCTAKSVSDCLKGIKEVAESENLINLACNELSALLACAGADLTPCQQAAISTACGAAIGALEGGLAGAGAGAVSGGGSDILQCICDLLKDVSLPPLPTGTAAGGDFGFGLSISGGNGWYVSGGSIGTGSELGPCSNPSAAAASTTQQSSLPPFLSRLKTPSRAKSTQGVCAHVRIRIEQSVTLTRAAFRGTLEIDNGGTTSISNILVSLDFRDATNGAAASKFVVEGPVVAGMTAADGTGTLAGGGSGSAVYTFVPTLDAAPNAPATYQIGGTLSYVDNGELVTVPLLSAPITVYPEARLNLVYFQQRDVYGDDPFTPQIEPSEPFALGLIVKNVGAGAAHNFQITSGQPQIVDNEKGLLINFNIIGTEVGGQPMTPSLSAKLGDIPPGSAKEVTWEMLSTLQGKFISFNASFEHVNDLGSTNTSLINSVEIHELIHPVLANRSSDDNVPDFLVNDIPDPQSLPDLLYLSDGTVAAVNVITNGTFDGQVGPGHLQVHLQSTATTGWNYFQLPDPGPGYLLQGVVRSDGKILALTNNAWTTDRSFPSSSTGAVYENLLHLFDWAGTGSYTLFYHSTNTTPPAILAVGPVTPFTQSGPVSAVTVVFSEPVDASTFSYTNLNLSQNGGANLITSGTGISLTLLSNSVYSINGLAAFTGADGNYQLTVSGAGIYDLWGNNAGNVSASAQWAKGNAAAVVQSISPIMPNPRNNPVTSVTVNFSKAINPATFTYQALSLTLNGGANLLTSSVTVSQQSATSFVVGNLGPLTGAEGNYVLTVNAAAVQDTGGLSGAGSQTVTWATLLTGPRIAGLEPINTNPRNIVVRNLNVTFAAPIDPTTFDYHDVTLTRDGGANLINSDVTVTALSPTTYQVGNISWVQGYAGNYSFTVNAAGILDLAGNPGAGSTNETWQIILEIPASPTNMFITPDLGISARDGLTGTNNVTLFGTVGASNMTVRIHDATAAIDLGTATVLGTNFSAPLSFAAQGQHRLQVTAVDIAGNVSPPSFFNLFLDVIPPTALVQQVPTPSYAPVSSILVTFSEAINTNTLAPGNFAVTLDGAGSFTPTLTWASSNSVVLGNLGFYTTPLGNYQVKLQLAGVQDLAGNQSTNIVTMSWTHGTTNLPPVLALITNGVVAPDRLLAFTPTAHDPNGDLLTFSLAPGAPAGASIDPVTGLFRWMPSRAFSESTNTLTIVVTDHGSPPMSASQAFTVTVLDYLELTLGTTNLVGGQSASLPLYLASNAGVTNVIFVVAAPENILTNWTISPLAPQLASATLTDQTTNLIVALRTLAGQSLQATQLVARLNFTATTNQDSAFISVTMSNLYGLKPTGNSYSNYLAHAGSVAVLQQRPFLVAGVANDLSRSLQLYGRVGTVYQLQSSTNLTLTGWQALLNYTQTNTVMTLPVPATNPVIFYRLQQQ